MVSHVNEKTVKKCSKKTPKGVGLSDTITLHKSKNLTISEQQSSSKNITNSKKSAVISRSDIDGNKSVNPVSTTSRNSNPGMSDSRCVDKAVLVYENKSDPERNRDSFKNEGPSVSGSTTWVPKLSRKSEQKRYRLKLKLYKAVIKILINARLRDLSDYNVIQDALKLLNENCDRKSDDKIENDPTNVNLGNKRPGIDVQIPETQSDARKSMELNETSTDNICEKNVTASTSKYFENEYSRSENVDGESTDCILSVEENEGTNSDATIHTTKRINKRRISLDKIADKKMRENGTMDKRHLQESVGVYEFNDSDIMIEEIVSGTSKTSGSSKKKHQKHRGTELEEINLSDVNEDRQLSPKIGQTQALKNKIKKRSSRKNKKVSEGSKSSFSEDKRREKKSKKEGRSSNQSKTDVGSKTIGRYCSCKPKKLMDVKTSAYRIPAEIECPSLMIRRGYGSRSTGVKSAQDTPESERKSPVDEKKTKKFYSALELEYSDVLKSKLDQKHDVKNLNNSSKRDKVTLEKSVNKVSKALKKFSISNFTLSPNSSRNNSADSQSVKKNASSSKLPTFSKYSIPVRIEINMTKNKLQKQSSGLNLIQSKITSYFPPKFSGFNSAMKCDENGNKLGGNRSKGVSHSIPKIESDILLKSTEKVIYSKNYTVRKSKLRFSPGDYFYDVINENAELSHRTTAPNQNVIFQEKMVPINDRDRSVDIIDDSNTSAGASIVPPSYSIFSNTDEDRPIIDINKILDTQQREALLSPWESVDIYEKINRWHDDAFEP